MSELEKIVIPLDADQYGQLQSGKTVEIRGYSVRRYIDGRLVMSDSPPALPDSPWYRKPVAEQAEPPKPSSHASIADKHGVYRLKVGASVVIPYGDAMPDALQSRISVVLRRRKLAWPERYNTKSVTGGIRVTRTI